MKKRKLIPALVLTLTLLCGITIGATASNGIQKIQADLDPTISVKYNGQEQVLKDANGTRIFPIAYNNTVYLPIRAVAGLAGLGVDWDGTTRSVLLGKQPGGMDLIDTYKIYHFSGYAGQRQTPDGYVEQISGITCNHFLWFDSMTNSVSFNLQGKHDTLTLSYYSPVDATLTVMGDNDTVLGEYEITGAAVAKTVTVPLLKTSELKLQMTQSNNAKARIFDAYLDAE